MLIHCNTLSILITYITELIYVYLNKSFCAIFSFLLEIFHLFSPFSGMHGVKKTPASEAQLAAKRKERNEKLEVFLGVRNMIFEKREKSELLRCFGNRDLSVL